MKTKSWAVNVNGVYTVVEADKNGVKINGMEYKYRELPATTIMLVCQSYELPINGAKVKLVKGSKMSLVVNGYDVDKKTEFVDKIPGWMYIFFALNAINLTNGALGCVMAFAGIYGCFSLIQSKSNTLTKVILATLITFACWLFVFIVVVALELFFELA